jgi:hypothetical protein
MLVRILLCWTSHGRDRYRKTCLGAPDRGDVNLRRGGAIRAAQRFVAVGPHRRLACFVERADLTPADRKSRLPESPLGRLARHIDTCGAGDAGTASWNAGEADRLIVDEYHHRCDDRDLNISRAFRGGCARL